MTRDPFDYQFDLLPDDLIQESANAKRSRAGWYATLAVVVLAALLILGGVLNWNVDRAQADLGGEKGVLQDGVYYIYAGGGMALPNEVRVPRGVVAYTPGQEPELLISTEDYRLDVLFPSWDVNSHGLYFSDMSTNDLYRMDLATREVTLLYDLPEAPNPAEGATDMTWEQALSGEYRDAMEAAMDYNPYLFLNGLWEDRIALICNDGISSYHMVLDCRTGEVLSKEKDDQGRSWNLVAGDRILVQYQGDTPDLRENGVSVLPAGHQLEEAESRSIGDAVLVISHPVEDMGDWTYQLFLADGRTLDLPKDTEETYCRYLAVSDNWLFYTRSRPHYVAGINQSVTELRAMDLGTMESYPVSEEYDPYFAVTDGTWFYSYGDQTNCYKLEYTPEGVPCDLTLIEERI